MNPLSRLNIIKGAIAVFVTGSVLSQPLSNPALTREIAQGRNLELYDKSGDFNAIEPIDGSRHHGKIRRIAALRKFIWEHWQKKRRGYITLSESGIDAGWTWHIFIEPTQKEDWHIALRIVSRSFLPPPEDGKPYPDTVSDRPEITGLKHAQRKRGDSPGGGEVLVFSDENGKEVWRL